MAFENPCTPDCKKRSATCHGNCIKYDLYAYAQEKEREKQHEENAVRWAADSGYRKNVAAKRRRQKQGKD